MQSDTEHPASIAVTEFKSCCLSVIDDDQPDLWGAKRGSVRVALGIDLTKGTGEFWDADR